MENTFIGIDLGTSGCRACLIDINENVLQEARVDLPDPIIQNQHVEQDPELWWQATKNVLLTLSEHPRFQNLSAISVDGTSSTLLVTDEDYNPLAPALMYNDARATNEAEQVRLLAPEKASAVFGASSSLSKLLWLLKKYPASKKALHQADYILGKLSGHYVSDFNNCLKAGFDPESEAWPDWLSKLSIPDQILPEVFAPGTSIGKLTTENQTLFGTSKPVHIMTGTTDSIAGFLATGASDTGDAVTSLGSTLVIKILSPIPINSAKEGIYSHRINNAWLAGGASNAGGSILRKLFDNESLQQLSEELTFNQPTGLSYYPLLKTGERFPENNPDKQACLTPRPDEDTIFLQAILESLTAIEKKGFELLIKKGAGKPERIFTVGGGSKNKKWMQYRSKQLDSKVIIPEHIEACYGTALLAKQGYIKTTNTGAIQNND